MADLKRVKFNRKNRSVPFLSWVVVGAFLFNTVLIDLVWAYAGGKANFCLRAGAIGEYPEKAGGLRENLGQEDGSKNSSLETLIGQALQNDNLRSLLSLQDNSPDEGEIKEAIAKLLAPYEEAVDEIIGSYQGQQGVFTQLGPSRQSLLILSHRQFLGLPAVRQALSNNFNSFTEGLGAINTEPGRFIRIFLTSERIDKLKNLIARGIAADLTLPYQTPYADFEVSILKNHWLFPGVIEYFKSIAAMLPENNQRQRCLYIASGADYAVSQILSQAVETIFVDNLPFNPQESLSSEKLEFLRSEYAQYKVGGLALVLNYATFTKRGELRNEVGARQYLVWEIKAMGAEEIKVEFDEGLGAYRIRFRLPNESTERSIIYFEIEDANRKIAYPETLINLIRKGLDSYIQKASEEVLVPDKIVEIIVNSLNPESMVFLDSQAPFFHKNLKHVDEESVKAIRFFEHRYGFGYGEICLLTPIESLPTAKTISPKSEILDDQMMIEVEGLRFKLNGRQLIESVGEIWEDIIKAIMFHLKEKPWEYVTICIDEKLVEEGTIAAIAGITGLTPYPQLLVSPKFLGFCQEDKVAVVIHELWHTYIDIKYPQQHEAYMKIYYEMDNALKNGKISPEEEKILEHLRNMFSDALLMRIQIRENYPEAALNYANFRIRDIPMYSENAKAKKFSTYRLSRDIISFAFYTYLPFQLEGKDSRNRELKNKVMEALKRELPEYEDQIMLAINNAERTAKLLTDKDWPSFEQMREILSIFGLQKRDAVEDIPTISPRDPDSPKDTDKGLSSAAVGRKKVAQVYDAFTRFIEGVRKSEAKEEYDGNAADLREEVKKAKEAKQLSKPQALILYSHPFLEDGLAVDLKESLKILLENNILDEVILYAEEGVYNDILEKLISEVKKEMNSELVVTKKTRKGLGLRRNISEVKEVRSLVNFAGLKSENSLGIIKGRAKKPEALRKLSRDLGIAIILFEGFYKGNIYSFAQALQYAIEVLNKDVPPVATEDTEGRFKYNKSLQALIDSYS